MKMSATGEDGEAGRPAPTSGSNPADSHPPTANPAENHKATGLAEQPPVQELLLDKVFCFQRHTMINQLIDLQSLPPAPNVDSGRNPTDSVCQTQLKLLRSIFETDISRLNHPFPQKIQM